MIGDELRSGEGRQTGLMGRRRSHFQGCLPSLIGLQIVRWQERQVIQIPAGLLVERRKSGARSGQVEGWERMARSGRVRDGERSHVLVHDCHACSLLSKEMPDLHHSRWLTVPTVARRRVVMMVVASSEGSKEEER